MLETLSLGCHHRAGTGDRWPSGTARHCANSRAARTNWNFAAGCTGEKLSDPEEHASKSFEDDQRKNQIYYESAYDRWA
jgi:hypothetical protein